MISWAERAKVAIGQKGQYVTAITDETAVSRLVAVSSVSIRTSPTWSERLSSVLTVPSPTVLEKCDSLNSFFEDPERWCWPHSSAMNDTEIDLFLARRQRFTDKSLIGSDRETLADKLVTRDRESDDRHVCLECRHLTGHGARAWRCGNWRAAGVAHQASDAQLASDLVVLPQRCNGFTTNKQLHAIKESEV